MTDTIARAIEAGKLTMAEGMTLLGEDHARLFSLVRDAQHAKAIQHLAWGIVRHLRRAEAEADARGEESFAGALCWAADEIEIPLIDLNIEQPEGGV